MTSLRRIIRKPQAPSMEKLTIIKQSRWHAISGLSLQFVLHLVFLSFACATNASSGSCSDLNASEDIFGAECHILTVKENRADEDSSELNIRVLRLPSIQESEKPPIVFIAGGPGQASGDLLENFRHQFSPLLVKHDFIFVDQRGTGYSNPLNCDVNLLPHLDKNASELEALNNQELSRCISQYSADLRHYSTPYAVRDLEDVRTHFGYEKLLLWGGSYGTRVVMEYLRAYPESISAAVLDGLAPVQIQLPTFSERDANRSLKLLLEQCSSQASCKEAFPDLASKWQQHLKIRAENPLTLALKHPRTQKSHNVYISNLVLSSWVQLILYSREIAPILPFALAQAIEGNYEQLFSVFVISRETMPEMISEVMQAAVLCAEDKRYFDLHTKTEGPETGSEDNALLQFPPRKSFDSLCQFVPESKLSSDYFSEFVTDVPALLLSGNFDPVTPPIWAQKVLPQFNNARHFVVPGGHHIVSRNSCVADIIADFLTEPTSLESLETECIDKIQPTPFFIDTSGPDMDALLNKEVTLP